MLSAGDSVVRRSFSAPDSAGACTDLSARFEYGPLTIPRRGDGFLVWQDTCHSTVLLVAVYRVPAAGPIPDVPFIEGEPQFFR